VLSQGGGRGITRFRVSGFDRETTGFTLCLAAHDKV
jgi:hypothetical protein